MRARSDGAASGGAASPAVRVRADQTQDGSESRPYQKNPAACSDAVRSLAGASTMKRNFRCCSCWCVGFVWARAIV